MWLLHAPAMTKDNKEMSAPEQVVTTGRKRPASDIRGTSSYSCEKIENGFQASCPERVVGMMKKLLFSQDCADVIFELALSFSSWLCVENESLLINVYLQLHPIP